MTDFEVSVYNNETFSGSESTSANRLSIFYLKLNKAKIKI